ncbi:class III signal peptide-containing protein [Methanobrevibacter sp. 87.7]|uniref:class III signal peptide-containing protein n=1 Tax=Methanobrevibacter sp. 87.7 TaxID=387957 RepID=UPI000B5118EE|nr:class III signal peptide-containing protein [Methanobrevibacter sp. 87.7]OWT32710.1 class III signal peptide-containing protein [Methanobrevibacter sp. 87.7]
MNKLKYTIEKLNKEYAGQGAAEYILLFGGVIVIAIAAILIYKSYFQNSANKLNASSDMDKLRENISA